MPVDVPIHLVLREKERLERGEPLLENPDRQAAGCRIIDDGERVQQTVDVDLPVRDAAHQRIALEVLDLVEIQRPGDEPLQRRRALSADERVNARGHIAAERAGEHLGDRAAKDQLVRDFLMVEGADLLERVRKRIMSDVMQERRRGDDRALARIDPCELAALGQEGEGAPGEMIRAERVLEARVSGTGIDEVGEPELANVAQPLERGRVDEANGDVIDADVVPERVADDGHEGQGITGSRCRGIEGAYRYPRFGALDPSTP